MQKAKFGQRVSSEKQELHSLNFRHYFELLTPSVIHLNQPAINAIQRHHYSLHFIGRFWDYCNFCPRFSTQLSQRNYHITIIKMKCFEFMQICDFLIECLHRKNKRFVVCIFPHCDFQCLILQTIKKWSLIVELNQHIKQLIINEQK